MTSTRAGVRTRSRFGEDSTSSHLCSSNKQRGSDMADSDDAVTHVDVEGCGIPCFNAAYKRSNKNAGVYRHGANNMFCLERGGDKWKLQYFGMVRYSSEVVDPSSQVPPEKGWTSIETLFDPPPRVIARRVSPTKPSASGTKRGTAAASSSSTKQGDDDDKRPAPSNAEDEGGNNKKRKASSTAEDVLVLETARKYKECCQSRLDDIEEHIQLETQRIEEETRLETQRVAEEAQRVEEATQRVAEAKSALEGRKRKGVEVRRELKEARDALTRIEHSKDVIAIEDEDN